MNILLMKPNRSGYLNERYVALAGVDYVPIGLGYLASAVRRARRDRLKIVDAFHEKLTPGQTATLLRETGPDVVGIQAYDADAQEARDLAALVKTTLPRAKVVFGGPYVSANHEASLADPNVDVAVVGEGEDTFVELLNCFDDGGRGLEHVKGIVYREDGIARRTPARPLIADLDNLFPAWDLLHPEEYFHHVRRNSYGRIRWDYRSLPIFSSRGCPYQCIFCHSVFAKSFRQRGADSILHEVTELKERCHAHEVEFIDDCFNASLPHAKNVLGKLEAAKLGLHFAFPNGLRGDRVDQELVDLLRDIGVYRVSYAVESAHPRIQQIIRKNIDVEKVRETIALTVRRGIITVGFFMMGFPGETVEEMQYTADYAAQTELVAAHFFRLAPYPGTEVAQMAQFKLSPGQETDLFTVNLSAASEAELQATIRAAYRKFYLDPTRLLRGVRVFPRNALAMRNALTVGGYFYERLMAA